jgi:hypothetical protein
MCGILQTHVRREWCSKFGQLTFLKSKLNTASKKLALRIRITLMQLRLRVKILMQLGRVGIRLVNPSIKQAKIVKRPKSKHDFI